jgi:hypothetical protein
MSVQDPAAPVALPDRARPLRWGYYAVRALLVVVLLAVAALVPGRREERDDRRLREGEIARRRVVAPMDFVVYKDETTLRREQERAGARIPPVFVADPRVPGEVLSRFADFRERALAVVLDPSVAPGRRAERLRGLGVPLTQEAAGALAAGGRARRVFLEVEAWLRDSYAVGVVPEKTAGRIYGHASIVVRDGAGEVSKPAADILDRREALDRLDRRVRRVFPGDPGAVRLVDELAAALLEPSVRFDDAETNYRRAEARGAVPDTLGMVAQNELIVDANERVTRSAALKLQSLANLEASQRVPAELLYPPVARVLFMLFFIVVFLVYLRIELPRVFHDNHMLSLFTLLTVVFIGLAELQAGVLRLSEFTVPLALAPLVVASLLEKRPALMFTMVLVVVATSVSGLSAPFVPVAALGGVTAVYSVSRLRHRWHFAAVFFTIAVAQLAGILAWDLIAGVPLRAMLLDVGYGALSAFLAVGIAFLLLPPVETMFGLTSDMTLLELSDLNRPLLRRLQLEAPGTYHHSMIVGNLAEAAADNIHANSLLVRVMAYYHDIGKLEKPEYYQENEFASLRSRHEKLSPNLSALVLRSHITDGLELARRNRLPKVVRDAIPEHHGTMVMAFFYAKAFEADPSVRRDDFCYPGPKPRSKETAILMLADGVEGASRALQDPRPSRLRGLIERIIEDRVQQGQLDDCGLTFQELAGIREAFNRVLNAVFHGRAPYPEMPGRRARDARSRKIAR